MSTYSPAPERWTLSDLTLAVRLTLAMFLISVGVGYLSALVNLHFQEASPGNLLPDESDVLRSYRGTHKVSQFERLLLAHSSLPFNGQGQMRAAFMKSKAGGISKDMKKKAALLKLDLTDAKVQNKVEEAVLKDINGERLALIGWLRAGAPKEVYEQDQFKLEGKLAEVPLTPRFLEEVAQGKEIVRFARVKSIIDSRCVRCHSEGVGGAGSQYSLTDYDDISHYTGIEKATGKSLSKLAMTTHVHLLSFSLLWGLTGLLLALSSMPVWIRLPLAPLALVAQLVDISFWWLAQLEEPYGGVFASLIRVSGGIVGASVALQIVLTLFSMFRTTGRVILLFLFMIAIGGGMGLKQKIIDPYLEKEKESMRFIDKE
jgi:hypothetical protein